MGKSLKKVLREFIQNIPDDDLVAFPAKKGTIFKDEDFRLDNQGVGRDQLCVKLTKITFCLH